MNGVYVTALLGFVHDVWAFLVAERSWLAAILGWGVGTLVTNWLGLSRERRTERNTDAKVLRERVLGLLDQGHAIGLHDRLHRNEVDSLRQHLGCWSRRRLDSAFKAYQQTCEQGVTQDAIGQPHRSNGAEVARHLRAILKETKRV